MKKVTKIAETANSKVKLKKIRVAAYCRVSMDSDAQLESLPDKEADQEQRHRPSILRRGRPRSDHSEGALYAGAGRACPPPGSPRQPDRQETQLLLQSLFCTDGFLRRLR